MGALPLSQLVAIVVLGVCLLQGLSACWPALLARAELATRVAAVAIVVLGTGWLLVSVGLWCTLPAALFALAALPFLAGSGRWSLPYDKRAPAARVAPPGATAPTGPAEADWAVDPTWSTF